MEIRGQFSPGLVRTQTKNSPLLLPAQANTCLSKAVQLLGVHKHGLPRMNLQRPRATVMTSDSQSLIYLKKTIKEESGCCYSLQ